MSSYLGFSLIEMLVGLGVASVLMVLMTKLWSTTFAAQRSTMMQLDRINLHSELRSLLLSPDFCRCNFGSGAATPAAFNGASPPASLALNSAGQLDVRDAACNVVRPLLKEGELATPRVRVDKLLLTDLSPLGGAQYSANLEVSFLQGAEEVAMRPLEVSGLILTTSPDPGTPPDGVKIDACAFSEAPPFTRSQSFRTPGTYTWIVPVGVSQILVEAWGAGGGGGGARWYSPANDACGGGGGGAGGYVKGYLAVSPGASYTVTVGAAGTGGAAGGGLLLAPDNAEDGSDGGASRFATSVVALGGLGGTGCNYSTHSCPSGCFSVGYGTMGGCKSPGCRCSGCVSGQIIMGGAGSNATYNYDSSSNAMGGAGGSAPMGGPGAPANPDNTITSNPGIAPGGGGGGGIKYDDGLLARPGSNGGHGQVTIWW